MYLLIPLLIITFCVFAEGCSKQGEDKATSESEKTTLNKEQNETPPEKQLKDDEIAIMTLHEIRARLDRFKSATDEDLKRLREIETKYPDERAVTTTLSYAMLVSRDWEGLAILYLRLPETELYEEDKMILAQVLVKTGRYEKAIEVLKPLAKEMDNNLGLLILQAHAYSFLGKYKEAVELLDENWDEVIRHNAVEALLIRAMIYFYDGEEIQALDMLNEAFAMDSDSVELEIRLHNSISRVLSSLGENQKAQTHSETASELYNKYTEDEKKKYKLGSLSRALNEAFAARNIEECERIIQHMLADADRDLQASLYKYLSEIYQTVGRTKDAQEAAKKSMELAGNSGG